MIASSSHRIGIVGAGYWGKNLIRNFHNLGVLAAICDESPDTRSRISEQYPAVIMHETTEALIADSSISAIVVATPAATHGNIVSMALDAGKHVFVEKPLCLDLDEGHLLKKKSESRNLTLMVGHLLLYHPAFVSLQAIVAEGALGTLRYITSSRLSLGKIRREENALWSFAPHDISMILKLAGHLPSLVSANGGSYLTPLIADTTLSHYTFDKDLQAHVFVSWLHPYKHQELVVIGSQGMAVFNDVAAGPEKLMLYKHQIGWDGDIPEINKVEGIPIPYMESEPLKTECEHFLDCIDTGTSPTSGADEGLRVLQVLDASQRSLSSGMPVMIDGDQE